jgi:23S rRNA (adenine2503-C2)-methyltransferase
VTVYDLGLEQLTERLAAWDEPAFRAKQVYRQLWFRNATYEEMPDVPKRVRERLEAELPLEVELLDERTADRGATRKVLLRLGGKHVIETVLMGYRDRATACVSSQSGCAMDCSFCATGQMGLMNNLSAGEIAAQVVWARRAAAHLPPSTPQRITNVVFMGMGEPFANERPVLAAVARLTDPQGMKLGSRHITISTVGVVPGIKRLPEEEGATYHTLSGMLIVLLGRLPQLGEPADWQGWRLEVIDMDGKRIDKILAVPIVTAG